MFGSIILIVILLVCGFLVFYCFWFLRDPKITIPKGTNRVSPASGTVSQIIRLRKGKIPTTLKVQKGLVGKIHARVQNVLGQKEGYLISIVMTPLDVHYQYAPCDGTIQSVKHVQGKLLNAVWGADEMRATLENEHTEILLKSGIDTIGIYQIAGFVARRIHTFVKNGQKVKKGQKLGIITLGSQVSIVIPKAKLKVRMGQHLKGGEDILAEY
ncbi:MAG TPA: phosphatidylserine decarboxylase [Candidatus Nanoarchaeia archaeon]|nr:phosphatidylserine decarboxylase [Candidatus Nanoarchaeia archaeon]